MISRRIAVSLAALLLTTLALHAEDWPEWRGKGRRGVWTETGILEKFPADGLKVSWRAPIAAGYTGPAVADGRVYVTDFRATEGHQGIERALCLDEETGEVIWTREWEVDYRDLQYAYGPRATPTVDGDRVYVLGAMGMLHCLNAITGEVIWRKDYMADYGAQLPTWGFSGAPLVDGNRLICLVGGDNNAKVVAFDKMTGKEIWRALSSDSEPGYDPPFLLEAGGVRQLIIWHPVAVSSLNPQTGEVYWEHPFKIQHGLTVATPVLHGDRLLVSAFYNGSRMFRLDPNRPAAELIWKGNSDSEIETDGLHSLVSTPVIDGDTIYGICSYGQFRAIDAKTGKRLWETMDVVIENERWATGMIVKNGDRYFVNNDRGDLIIARFTREGYHEIDRTKFMEPTTPVNRRREFNAVNWSHPAFANRHMIARNDKEIIRYSMANE